MTLKNVKVKNVENALPTANSVKQDHDVWSFASISLVCALVLLCHFMGSRDPQGFDGGT